MTTFDSIVEEGDVARAGRWPAQLALRFERERRGTVLVRRSHRGPLRVLKALYPEGPEVCQAIIVHPPGGIAGGDVLDIAVEAGPAAQVQVTTPGAAKWYRSEGAYAESKLRIRASPGSVVEWLPQEAIVFDRALASVATRIDLEGDAVFMGWDIVSLGRGAAGERFTEGRLRQTFEVLRDARLVWCERALIDGGSPALQSGAVLGAAPVFGAMFVAAAALPDAALAACRARAPPAGDGAVTRLPGLLLARYRGQSAGEARMYFASLWQALRPRLIGRGAVAPRIWAT
jgi:urease accessory protein